MAALREKKEEKKNQTDRTDCIYAQISGNCKTLSVEHNVGKLKRFIFTG